MANEIELTELRVRVEILINDVAALEKHRDADLKETRDALQGLKERISAMEKPLEDLSGDRKAIIKKMWGLLWSIIAVIVTIALGLKDGK